MAPHLDVRGQTLVGVEIRFAPGILHAILKRDNLGSLHHKHRCQQSLPEMTLPMTLAELQSDFSVLDDWEDRYRYIIELGHKLAPMPAELKTEATKVRGCASQVWLVSEAQSQTTGMRMHFTGDSDAHIVRGLVAIVFAIYEGKSPAEVMAIDPATVFEAFGLKEHLTPQRSNGLASMVERIRADARNAAESG